MPDWNLILGFAGVGIILVGGFVKLNLRLAKIETRLQVDDGNKAERDAARRLEMADIARGELRVHKAECPNRELTGVNPQGGF